MNNSNESWQKDFQEFLAAQNEVVPTEMQEKTAQSILHLINPNSMIVFLKLLGIHSVIGFFSLTVCHQFGYNPFNTEWSLSDWMMSFGGHHFCMVGCGVMFVSLSVILAGLILSSDEVRALKRNHLLHNAALAVISLGLFAAVGAELALSIAGLWLIGSMLGGLVTMLAIFQFHGLKDSSVT